MSLKHAEHNASFINGRRISVLCSTSTKEEWLTAVFMDYSISPHLKTPQPSEIDIGPPVFMISSGYLTSVSVLVKQQNLRKKKNRIPVV